MTGACLSEWQRWRSELSQTPQQAVCRSGGHRGNRDNRLTPCEWHLPLFPCPGCSLPCHTVVTVPATASGVQLLSVLWACRPLTPQQHNPPTAGAMADSSVFIGLGAEKHLDRERALRKFQQIIQEAQGALQGHTDHPHEATWHSSSSPNCPPDPWHKPPLMQATRSSWRLCQRV